MKILVVMQNAYSYRPLTQKIPYAVWWRAFLRSRSGKRMGKMFVDSGVMQLMHSMGVLHFTNTTDQWGLGADSILPANMRHLQVAVGFLGPDYVIACGRQAEEAILKLWNWAPKKFSMVAVPHPASRTLTDALYKDVLELILEHRMDAPMGEYIITALRQKRGSHEREDLTKAANDFSGSEELHESVTQEVPQQDNRRNSSKRRRA